MDHLLPKQAYEFLQANPNALLIDCRTEVEFYYVGHPTDAINIEWSTAYNGDEVVLIGEQGGERITAEELAEWAGTIPYEVLTAINDRVPRIYEP